MIKDGVSILRLMTGEDIIGLITEDKTGYYVTCPFKLVFRRIHTHSSGIAMFPWLPYELLDSGNVYIQRSNVLCVMDAKLELVECYADLSDDLYMTLTEQDGMYRSQLKDLHKSFFEPESMPDDNNSDPTVWN